MLAFAFTKDKRQNKCAHLYILSFTHVLRFWFDCFWWSQPTEKRRLHGDFSTIKIPRENTVSAEVQPEVKKLTMPNYSITQM